MQVDTARYPGSQHVSPKIINGKHIKCRHRSSEGNPQLYTYTKLHVNYTS